MINSIGRRTILRTSIFCAITAFVSDCSSPGPRPVYTTPASSPTSTPNATVKPVARFEGAPTATVDLTAAKAETPPPAPPSPAIATPKALEVARTPSPIAVSATPISALQPTFSDVLARTPRDGVQYLRGRLREYPGGSASSVFGFSPSDILETLDTVVVDRVRASHGDSGLNQVYDTIASQILATLRDLYGNAWVLVALDAGHGGDKAEFWDSGSNGTEALHSRAVVKSILSRAKVKEYSRFILKPVFNDNIPDNFGVPGKENEPLVNQTVMRQIRGAMLAHEAAAWNGVHQNPSDQVLVHELSIHFNSGVGGAMVLHQGDTVPKLFQQRSLDYGKRFLQRVVPALNATGVLPSVLGLFGGTGLHDDVMMYVPGGQITDEAGNPIVLRYGMLQGGGFARVYVQKILKYG